MALLGVVGCMQTKVASPLTPAEMKNPDPVAAQMDYWHDITNQPIICNDDAFHGLLLFLDEKDQNADYAARVAVLKSRNLLPSYFNAPGDVAVRRGVIAYAVVQALHIRGGWALSLLGPTERYALRELMNMNLFPRSSPEQTFTGAEFVGIMGRVEDYQDGESAFIPAKNLPATPGD